MSNPTTTPFRPLLDVDATERERAPILTPAPDAESREPDWDGLEPCHAYTRRGRRILNGLLLVVATPLAVAIALPIALVNWIQFGRLDEILFLQPRVGYRGRVFWIYKFRTMRTVTQQSSFTSWRQGGDELRVTRFGRLLRNTHLDELPQLLNILRGEMQFIGPRPEMVEIDRWAREVVPGFERRNALRPGITGLAQITQGYTGMNADDYAEKLAADLRYQENLSARLDLSILVRTALWMVRGRGWGWKRKEEESQDSARSAA